MQIPNATVCKLAWVAAVRPPRASHPRGCVSRTWSYRGSLVGLLASLVAGWLAGWLGCGLVGWLAGCAENGFFEATSKTIQKTITDQ